MTYGTLPPQRYPRSSKVFHWLVAICVLVQIPVALAMTRIADGPPKDNLFALHKALGVTLLILVVLRVINRFIAGAPLPEPGIARWQRAASSAVHGLLYLLLLAMTFVGWLGMSAFGEGAPFFDLFSLPKLPIAKDEALSKQLFMLHRWMGYLLAVVVAVHIGAALQHHFILKDGVLLRMLPRALGGR